MAIDSARRSVTVERVAAGQLSAVNPRGGRITVGDGGDGGFTPSELLLAAIGTCTGIDVDVLTSRRSEPDSFRVRVDANKIRDESGNLLTDIEVTFHITFPDTPAGDEARAMLPEAVRRSHDRWCTVGRTVEKGTAIGTRIE